MKYLIALFFIGFNLIGLASKTKEPLALLNCSKVKGDFLWMSNFEVSNAQYRVFLSKQQTKISRNEYVKLLPDTLAWKKILGNSEPFINYYFRHPSYNNFPVVCINYEQAQAFCIFLTVLFNEMFENDTKCNYEKVIVRLPTKEEWTYAAIGGLSPYNEYPWDGKDVLHSSGKLQGQARANFLRTNEAFGGVSGGVGSNSGVDVLAPVKSYLPNGYGLYNMSGNAAELISEPNIAMGGSFLNPHNQIKVTSEQNAKETSGSIGFRFVVEILRFKPQLVKSKLDVTKKSFYKKNFVTINDTLSIMKTEVSNELYNLYCSQTQQSRPDSTLWNDLFYGSSQFTTHYHWHSKFGQFPVVNITKEDADKFCFWLTQHYVRAYSVDAQIRLPKKEEHIKAIEITYNEKVEEGGRPAFFDGNIRAISSTYQGDMKQHYKSIFFMDTDTYIGPSPITERVNKKHKIYNLTGNVDEMLHNDALLMQRNWSVMADEWIVKSIAIKSASPKVGFRVVLIKK